MCCSLLAVCNQLNQQDRIPQVLEKMRTDPERLKPNIYTYVALIEGQSKNGDASQALALLNEMLQTVGTKKFNAAEKLRIWNKILSVFAAGRQRDGDAGKDAEEDKMKDLAQGNEPTSFLSATYQVWKMMREDEGLEPNARTLESLVVACVNHGNVARAHATLHKMQRLHSLRPTVDCWNPIIEYYAKHDKLESAWKYVEKMQRDGGLQPTERTLEIFVSGCKEQGRWLEFERAVGRLQGELAKKQMQKETRERREIKRKTQLKNMPHWKKRLMAIAKEKKKTQKGHDQEQEDMDIDKAKDDKAVNNKRSSGSDNRGGRGQTQRAVIRRDHKVRDGQTAKATATATATAKAPVQTARQVETKTKTKTKTMTKTMMETKKNKKKEKKEETKKVNQKQ